MSLKIKHIHTLPTSETFGCFANIHRSRQESLQYLVRYGNGSALQYDENTQLTVLDDVVFREADDCICCK